VCSDVAIIAFAIDLSTVIDLYFACVTN